MTKKEKCELRKKELSEYYGLQPKPIHEQIIEHCGGEERFKEIAGLKPKQEIKLEDIFNYEKKRGVRDLIDAHKQTDENGKPITYWGGLEEPKQETLEDASWKYNPLKKLDGEFLRHAFKEGARWQAENMFSEEQTKLIKGLINLYWTEHNSEHPTNLKELELSKSILEKLKNR
jgi:hypothetical protein